MNLSKMPPVPTKAITKLLILRSTSQLTVVLGPMFAGKTTRLLEYADYYAKQGSVLLIKPKSDTRYSTDNIVSHSRASKSALSVDTLKDAVT